jgi:predicted metal-dependent hydrolase
MGWINRQRSKFQAQARQSQREYVSGETHFHLGQRYRLRVIERRGSSRVQVSGDQRLELAVPAGSDVAFREKVFQRWQRALLRKRAQVLVDEWSAKLGVAPPTLGIKRMKTKWGTCNHAERRIWLNLELIKKPPEYISYIALHEIAHLIEPNHGEAFLALLDLHMPNWRTHRNQLNAEPLAHEEWHA